MVPNKINKIVQCFAIYYQNLNVVFDSNKIIHDKK